jgi:hypothetical protein
VARSTFNARSVTAAEARKTVRSAIVVDSTVQKQFKKLSSSLQQKVVDTVRVGIQRGEPTGIIAKRLAGGVIDGVAVPGVMKATRVQASALVHSAVISASVKDRLAVFRENSDVIKAIQQVSTLDNRTTETCIAYNNATWEVDTLDPIGHDLPFEGGPPRHHNCRSVIVPVVRSPDELGVKVKGKIPQEIRASMDGKVASDVSFRQFLEGKGQQFAEHLLGPEKAKLFMSNRINERDLLNSSGKPVSPEELLKKVKGNPAPASYKGTGFTKLDLDEQAQVLFDANFDELSFAKRKEVLTLAKAGSIPVKIQGKSAGAASVNEMQFQSELNKVRDIFERVTKNGYTIDSRIEKDFARLIEQAGQAQERLKQIRSMVKHYKNAISKPVLAKMLQTLRVVDKAAKRNTNDKFLQKLKGEAFEMYKRYVDSSVWQNDVARTDDKFAVNYVRWKELYREAIGYNRDVDHYVGIGYRSLNSSLRTEKLSQLKAVGSETFQFMKRLQKVMNKFSSSVREEIFSRDVVVFRGVSDTAFRVPPPGKVIMFKGFTSASTRPSISVGGFAKKERTALIHMYEIVIPKGSRGPMAGFNINEAEILFDTHSKFMSLGNRFETYHMYGENISVQVTRLVYIGG